MNAQLAMRIDADQQEMKSRANEVMRLKTENEKAERVIRELARKSDLGKQ